MAGGDSFDAPHVRGGTALGYALVGVLTAGFALLAARTVIGPIHGTLLPRGRGGRSSWCGSSGVPIVRGMAGMPPPLVAAPGPPAGWPRSPRMPERGQAHSRLRRRVVEGDAEPGVPALLRPRGPPAVDQNGYGLHVPGIVISPYAKRGYIDHQILSFDAYDKFIEDDFLNGERRPTRPETGRPRERKILGNLISDFDFSQNPRPPVLLPVHPRTTLTGTPGRATSAATGP